VDSPGSMDPLLAGRAGAEPALRFAHLSGPRPHALPSFIWPDRMGKMGFALRLQAEDKAGVLVLEVYSVKVPSEVVPEKSFALSILGTRSPRHLVATLSRTNLSTGKAGMLFRRICLKSN
jgi:hypothetical protein